MVTAVAGSVVTLKAAPLVPVKLMLPIFSVPVPALEITKLFEAAEPKLVRFVVVVVTPIGTVFPLPETVRLAPTVAGVVDPETTPPGLVQLEVDPFRAKLIRVPLAGVAELLKVNTAELLPDGIP